MVHYPYIFNICLRHQRSRLRSSKMNKVELTNELQRITGKGKMACEINMALAGGDIDKAIERMKISYPGLEVKK